MQHTRRELRVSYLLAQIIVLLTVSGMSRAQTLDEQFALFLSWWPGTYDNVAQVTAAPDGVRAIRLQLQPVTLPAFGTRVLYAEWHDLQQPATVLRQRFYAFSIDAERQVLRLNLHIFPPDPAFSARTSGAHDNPEKIADVTPADMFPLPGCDVFFTWQDDHFAGAMDKGSCAFTAPGTTDEIYSWSQMRLTAETFAYLDGWFYPDGRVYRVLDDDWRVFERRVRRHW